MEKLFSLFKDKKKLIFGVFVLGIVIFIVVILLTGNSTYSLSDGALFKNEYEKLNNVASEDGKKYPMVIVPDNNKMKYTSYDEVIDIFNNNGDAVVYLGYPTCLYCRTAVQVLLNSSQNMDIDNILYLNIEKKHERYNELLDLLGDDFVSIEDNDKKIYSPLVIFIVDGNIVSYQKGTLFSQEDPYVELDKSQIDGLSEIYKYGIQDVINGLNING